MKQKIDCRILILQFRLLRNCSFQIFVHEKMWWTRQIPPEKNVVITNSSILSIQMKILFVRNSWDFRGTYISIARLLLFFIIHFMRFFSFLFPNSYLLTSKFLSIILYVIKIFDEFSSHTNSVCVVNPSGWNDWTISYIFLRFLQYKKIRTLK